MASDDIKDAIERLLREKGHDAAEVVVIQEQDFKPLSDDDDNASTLMDRSLATLDHMADDGLELAKLLQAHKRFITQVFGQLSALIVKNGGMVRVTRAELDDAMNGVTMAGTWDDDTLVLTATKDTGKAS